MSEAAAEVSLQGGTETEDPAGIDLDSERTAAIARNNRKWDERKAERIASELWLEHSGDVGDEQIHDALADRCAGYDTERLAGMRELLEAQLEERRQYVARRKAGKKNPHVKTTTILDRLWEIAEKASDPTEIDWELVFQDFLAAGHVKGTWRSFRKNYVQRVNKRLRERGFSPGPVRGTPKQKAPARAARKGFLERVKKEPPPAPPPPPAEPDPSEPEKHAAPARLPEPPTVTAPEPDFFFDWSMEHLSLYSRFVVERLSGIYGTSEVEVVDRLLLMWMSDHVRLLEDARASLRDFQAYRVDQSARVPPS